MLQRLPILFAQFQAGNTSENLGNEICQIIYSLCQGKEITKKSRKKKIGLDFKTKTGSYLKILTSETMK